MINIPSKYNPVEVEDKWYSFWLKKGLFRSEPDNRDPYTIVIPPPNVTGYLHMGHVRNYSIGDSFARYKRMRGFNVIYPMGYDAFGLPAENAAIKEKVDPEKWTKDNIEGIKAQQKLMGLS